MYDDRANRPGLARLDSEDFTSYARRLDEYIQRLEWQSDGHRMWYTHKNKYGCWICDLLFIIGQFRDAYMAEDIATKPTESPKD